MRRRFPWGKASSDDEVERRGKTFFFLLKSKKKTFSMSQRLEQVFCIFSLVLPGPSFDERVFLSDLISSLVVLI